MPHSNQSNKTPTGDAAGGSGCAGVQNTKTNLGHGPLAKQTLLRDRIRLEGQRPWSTRCISSECYLLETHPLEGVIFCNSSECHIH